MNTSITDRSELLERFARGQQCEWDMIVVGGGITGAGILREASRQGYRVLLLEQRDFSWGTSSRSSKMVHGGLRYLASGDVKLTRESLHERERLLKEMPGLVDRLGYYFTVPRSGFLVRCGLLFLLSVYDRIAGIKDHRFFNFRQLHGKFQGLLNKKLRGACYYTDAVTDDSRLVMRVLQEGCSLGGSALNYMKVCELLTDNGEVIGVEAQSEEGQSYQLRAPVVINATGAWADRLRNQLNPEKRVRPLRGSHLVFAHADLPINDAFTIRHPQDKRAVFVFPWEGTTVVGTTDLDHNGDLDIEASITSDEVEYLLELVAYQFPSVSLSRADIVSSFAGVRPVIGSDSGKDPSQERRDHAVWSDSGLITVSGGKLTTFRVIAMDTLAAARPYLKGVEYETGRSLNQSSINVKDDYQRRILGRYGHLTQDYLKTANVEESGLIGATQFNLAECRWCIRNESVIHLDDLLLRRTRLGMLLRNGGAELMGALQKIFAEEQGWDQNRWQQELQRYRNIWQNYYYLPDYSVEVEEPRVQAG